MKRTENEQKTRERETDRLTKPRRLLVAQADVSLVCPDIQNEGGVGEDQPKSDSNPRHQPRVHHLHHGGTRGITRGIRDMGHLE